MDITKTERTFVEREVYQYTECDKCYQKIETESSFDQFECTFKYQEGEMFPEGGSLETQEIHLCQDCGKQILDLLKGKKLRVTVKHVDV